MTDNKKQKKEVKELSMSKYIINYPTNESLSGNKKKEDQISIPKSASKKEDVPDTDD